MDAKLRSYFESRWDDTKYDQLLALVDDPYALKLQFRLCETPVFLTDEFTKELMRASASIVDQVQEPEFLERSLAAVPAGEVVPGCDDHPQFLQIDFAVAEENGEFVPRLIELQGFASMFSYQVALDRAYRKAGLVPEDVTCYFNGLEEESYLKVLKQIICGDEAAESVILLEIKPELQRTRIDFSCTQEMIGINYKCLSDLYKVGRSLYYKDETGREVQVKRIYNRVIFDELKKTEIDLSFSITDDLDVTWVAHPNWFHRISKHSLPALNDVSVPKSYVIGELESIPDDLENYVLKPLYSFAGAGVITDVTPEIVKSVVHPMDTLLQRKVKYAEFIDTPSGKSKAEIRLMYFWDKEPVLANTLVRVSRGNLSSVSKNTTDTWIGSTTGYHRPSAE